jgi:hypothetical protein
MKKICLIETFKGGLNTIKLYLKEVNAQYSLFSSVEEASKSNNDFHLTILLASTDKDAFKKDIAILEKNRMFSKTPLLCITPYDEIDMVGDEEFFNHLTKIRFPVNKLEFLSKIAEMLNIPPRRAFRTAVSIIKEPEKTRYFGESVDFSATGMSFI